MTTPVDFGTGTPVDLHGSEVVISQSPGETLADMIQAAPEIRIAALEKRLADLEKVVLSMLAPLPWTLEDQHRLKVAARAKAREAA